MKISSDISPAKAQEIILQLLNDSDKVNLDDVLRQRKEILTKKEILKQHATFSNIWQGTGDDTRWKTYLPADNKRGRKLIACSQPEQLERKIIAYYKEIENNPNIFHILYLEWLNMKRLEVSEATIERIHTAYTKFYKDNPINDMSVKDITYLKLKEFLLSTIKKHNLNYKQYCNFSCVLRGVLGYAMDKEVIDKNPFDKFHLGKNVLRAPDNKSSKTQVFTIDERKQIEEAIWNDFKENPTSTIPLAVLLDFYTGLRSGELVTLSWNDISETSLHVHRTETSYTVINPDGTKGNVVYEVKEAPKSSAGFRDVELIPKAVEVLQAVHEFNQTHHWDNEFIFLDDNKRINRRRLDIQIRKYCRKLGISTRSMHKIRKYFVSVLKISNVEDNEIKRLAGHKYLTTTYNSYCFSVLSNDENRERMISAL